jgi:hypothetical protein
MAQQAAPAPIRPETREKLELLAYHPRHSSDPDAVLAIARDLLGRTDLTHGTLLSIGEDEAQRLIRALERRFPDKRHKVAAKVKRELTSRLD